MPVGQEKLHAIYQADSWIFRCCVGGNHDVVFCSFDKCCCYASDLANLQENPFVLLAGPTSRGWFGGFEKVSLGHPHCGCVERRDPKYADQFQSELVGPLSSYAEESGPFAAMAATKLRLDLVTESAKASDNLFTESGPAQLLTV